MERNIVQLDAGAVFVNIKNDHGFKNKDENYDSYYKEYTGRGGKKSYFRISNHITYLWTWVKHGRALSRSNNICVTFVDKEEKPTIENTSCDMNIYKKDDKGKKHIVGAIGEFEVKQYLYNVPNLNRQDIININLEIGNFFTSGKFTDPLVDIPQKRANGYILKPNQEPIQFQKAEIIQANNIATAQQPSTNNTVSESLLYPQWEMMHKLGCISTDLFESIVIDTI